MRPEFDTWLLTTYGYKPDGTPTTEAGAAEHPEQFLTKDGTFDIGGYERWVERMRKKYETIEMVRLSDGSFGPVGSLPPSPKLILLPAPAEELAHAASPSIDDGNGSSGT